MWLTAAVFSAIFAGLTSIFAKCGIKKTDSDVATAIRTIIVLLGSLLMVAICGSFDTITQIKTKSLVFLVFSGLATGASWICYFKALSAGEVNKVVPIDKSSTVLSVILAIIFFGETQNLFLKLSGTILLAVGIFLMIDKKESTSRAENNAWFVYAILSAFFAALTSILAKIGIDDVESNLGTSIRTVVVLIMAWIIVFARSKCHFLKSIDKKELFFIIISGFSTCASWLCYYYAVQNGVLSIVIPIDKMSVLFTVVFSYIFFKEKLSKKSVFGLFLMLVGTTIMAFS